MSTDFADAAPRKRGRALLIAGISGTIILLEAPRVSWRLLNL